MQLSDIIEIEIKEQDREDLELVVKQDMLRDCLVVTVVDELGYNIRARFAAEYGDGFSMTQGTVVALRVDRAYRIRLKQPHKLILWERK